jgi:tRNA(Ile)-lysidine synthase
LNYCQQHQLEPRIDSSNLSLSFLRNRCRLELLPLLRKYNPKVDEALLRLAEIAKSDNSFMEEQASGLWDGVARQEGSAIYLNKGKIGALPVALQRQLLRLAVAKILGDTRDIEVNHIEALRSLLSKPVGKRISLPHSLVCWSGYDEVGIMSLLSSPLKGGDEACPEPEPAEERRGEGGKPLPLSLRGAKQRSNLGGEDKQGLPHPDTSGLAMTTG